MLSTNSNVPVRDRTAFLANLNRKSQINAYRSRRSAVAGRTTHFSCPQKPQRSFCIQILKIAFIAHSAATICVFLLHLASFLLRLSDALRY